MVGDPLVAVDAGHVVFGSHPVLHARPLFLLVGAHALQAVAVAAFARIVGFHPRPFAARQGQALVVEFLAGIDGAEQLAPEPLGALAVAHLLVGPFLGHVAVGAGRPYAGAVGVVDGFLVFGIDVVAHLVAGDAEGFGVGGFHGGVEAAPENHPCRDT